MGGILPARGKFNVGKALKKAADPSGVLTGESRSFKEAVNPSTMLDPGGAILEAGGSTMGRDYADPLGMLKGGTRAGDSSPKIPEIPSMADAEAKKSEEKRKKDAAKRGRASTILSSTSGDLGSANVGSTTLGGR